MKITIFGATGRTGQQLLDQALAAGHEVTALIRDPAKIKQQHPKLTIVTGNLQDQTQLEQAITGRDAVISVLGPTENKPTYAITAGMEKILATMKKEGVERLIVSAGAGVSDPNDRPGLFNHLIHFLLRRFARYVYEDMVQTVAHVRDSELNWTVVRVPMLVDRPTVSKVRVGYVGKGIGSRLSRADLAQFLLQQLQDNGYQHKAPAISN